MRLSTVAIGSKTCVLAVGYLFKGFSGALLLLLFYNWLQKLLDHSGSIGNAEGGLASLTRSLLYLDIENPSAVKLPVSVQQAISPRILSTEPENGPLYKRVNCNLVIINVFIILSFLLTKAY